MSLGKEAIDEFKEIYFKEYGERISDSKAREMGESLPQIYKDNLLLKTIFSRF